MSFITTTLSNHHFPQSDIDSIQSFKDRDGFCLLEQAEFYAMMAYFSEFPDDFKDSIPITTDNNSNYFCVYTDGEFKHKVWYLSHDELNTTPKIASISELIHLINSHIDCYDSDDLLDKLGIR